ncbi:MAG: rhomboid family intramembrane serine protease, partial [Gemmataceae bacterium]
MRIDYNGLAGDGPPSPSNLPDPSHMETRRARTFAEVLLDRIQGMYPGNFHPRSFMAISGNDEESVLKTLDSLYQDGLVERTRDETLPDELLVRLSEKGRALYADPAALARWRDARAITRDTTRRMLGLDPLPGAAWSSRFLWILILANFAWGAWLAWESGLLGEYIHSPDHPGLNPIHQAIGAADAVSLAGGQWWRLLSCVLVHFGLLHLASNSVGLLAVGSLVSRMMGPAVVLRVFVIAGLWGSGFGVTFQAQATRDGIAGASGAICGLMAAFIVWFLTHRHLLEPKVAKRFGSLLMMDLLLITGISLMPGISGMGHLGGALGGALVSVGLLLLGDGSGNKSWRPIAGSLCLMLAGAGAAALVSSAMRAAVPQAEAILQKADATYLNQGLYPEFATVRVEYRKLVLNFAEPLQLRDKFRRNREMAAQAVDNLEPFLPRQTQVLQDWRDVKLQSQGMRVLAQRAVELL